MFGTSRLYLQRPSLSSSMGWGASGNCIVRLRKGQPERQFIVSVEGKRRVPHGGRPHFSSDNLINIFLVEWGGSLSKSQSPHNKKSIDRVYTEWCLTEWCTQALSPRLQNKCYGQARSSPTMALGALGLLEPGLASPLFPLAFFPFMPWAPQNRLFLLGGWVATFFKKYEVITFRDIPQKSQKSYGHP